MERKREYAESERVMAAESCRYEKSISQCYDVAVDADSDAAAAAAAAAAT